MSEKSKGDTSQVQQHHQSTAAGGVRVVKNPLLSASVTGLAFDDNLPLLLPAAPAPAPPPKPQTPTPPVRPTGPPPAVAGISAVNREPKSLVTVGSTSDLDTESLDEINLNAATEDHASHATQFDPNSNPLLDQIANTESILSQAAYSFSALPSVASSVLSTFSKRIYSGRNSRELTPSNDNNNDQDTNSNPVSQLDIQPHFLQQQQLHQQQLQQQQLHQQQLQQQQLHQQQLQQQQLHQQQLHQQQLQQQQQLHQQQLHQQQLHQQQLHKQQLEQQQEQQQQQQQEQQQLQQHHQQQQQQQQNQQQQQQQQQHYPQQQQFAQASIAPPTIHAPPTAFTPPAAVLGSNYKESSIPPSTQTSVVQPTPEPPKFYTPSEIPSLPTANAPPPPATGQNTYRLTAKKKYYAPIPGFSDQTQPPPTLPAIDPLVVNAPISFDSSQYPAHPTAQTQQANLTPYEQPSQLNPFTPQQAIRKSPSGGGLFSGVLQNLTGLVQSAADTITQTVKPDTYQQQQVPPFESHSVNYFGVQQGAGIAPSPIFYTPETNQQPIQSTNFFTQQSSEGSGSYPPQSQVTEVAKATPATQQAALAPPPISGFSARPPKTVSPGGNTSVATEKTAIPDLLTSTLQQPTQTAVNQVPLFNIGNLSTPPNLGSQPGTQNLVPNTIDFFNPTANQVETSLLSPKVASNTSTTSAVLTPLSSVGLQQVTQSVSLTPLAGEQLSKSGPTGEEAKDFGTDSVTTSTSPVLPPTQSAAETTSTTSIPATQPENSKGQSETSADTSFPPFARAPLSGPSPVLDAFLPHSSASKTAVSTPFVGFYPTSSTTPPSQQASKAVLTPVSVPTTTPVGQQPSAYSTTVSASASPLTDTSTRITTLFSPASTTATTQPSSLFSPFVVTAPPPPPLAAPPLSVPPLAATPLSAPPLTSSSHSGAPSSAPFLAAPPLSASTITPTPFATPPSIFTPSFSPSSQPSSSQPPASASLSQPPSSSVSATLGLSASFSSPAPPPASGVKPSFRLQKGTRHYASPLTSAETAPSYGIQPLGSESASQSPAYLDPFAPSITKPTSDPSFVPSYFIPGSDQAQSVELFPAAEEEKPVEKTKSISLLTTEQEDLFINKPESEGQKEEDKQQKQPVDLFTSFTGAQANDTTDLLKAAAQEKSETSSPPAEQQLRSDTPVSFEAQTIEAVLPSGASSDWELIENSEATAAKDIDLLDQALEKLSITTPLVESPLRRTSESSTQHLPPPPQSPIAHGQGNPFRKGSITGAIATSKPSAAPPVLANFFTPAPIDSDAGGDFNFFALTQTEVEPPREKSSFATNPIGFFNISNQTSAVIESEGESQKSTDPGTFPALPTLAGIAPLPLKQEVPAESSEVSQATLGVAPPIGFDSLLSEVAASEDTSDKVDTKNQSAENSFSNFFNPNTSNQESSQIQVPRPEIPNANSFFDIVFSPAPTAPPAPTATTGVEPTQLQSSASNEDQRIQNFFNNPPPKENSSGVGDLNYDLVHSGLGVRKAPNLRSLASISNLVEPPSSSCSEWSEWNTSNLSAGTPQKTVLDQQQQQQQQQQRQQQQQQLPRSANHLDAAALERASYLPEPTETNFESVYPDSPTEVLEELKMLAGEKSATSTAHCYSPAVKHWFYKRLVGGKHIWVPFSHYDSALLETTLTMGDDRPNIVAVEGGRYDVNINERSKVPVYWEGDPMEVRRCSWFYKGTDSKFIPYQEEIADLLEEQYKQAYESNTWQKKCSVGTGTQFVFHGPSVIVEFQQQQNTDSWGGSTQSSKRPRVVKRDLDDLHIEQGESQRVDHLLFMVHGIGSACDLKMRSVEEVVEDFRSIAQQLVASHYKNSTEMGLVGRVEVLPISWHSHLHSEEMGIDEKLKSITLESIPKLRNFTNDTLLDVLFYTSPIYCQKIMNTVAASMNSVYLKYRERNPDFNGGVSLAGHSLGSLILFDLLCHQTPLKESEEENKENPDQQFQTVDNSGAEGTQTTSSAANEILSKQISYTMGPAGTGQPFIQYSQLVFQPKKFFALGSPIGMFVTIRGIDKLGLDFRLPTCAGFYNIFHPFDPVAYRIEALVNPDMSGIRPVLIPHHKGRKRMHLELKETMTRVGADLKQRFLDTFKSTLDSVNFLGSSSRQKKEIEETMGKEVDKVLQMQLQLEQQQQDQNQNQQQQQHEQQSLQENNAISHSSLHNSPQPQPRTRADSTSTTYSDVDMIEVDFPLGKLNDSKRIDYVLQEAPLEFFNEYLFALSSHVCYWESSDTILFVMKEIYAGLGISPDSQVPQQSMTIERPTTAQTLLSPTI